MDRGRERWFMRKRIMLKGKVVHGNAISLKSESRISSALSLSALTVKSHLARIARKLGTGDRAGMVATAMRARAID